MHVEIQAQITLNYPRFNNFCKNSLVFFFEVQLDIFFPRILISVGSEFF